MNKHNQIIEEKDLDFIRVTDSWSSLFPRKRFDLFMDSIKSGDINRREINNLDFFCLAQSVIDIISVKSHPKNFTLRKDDLAENIFSTLISGRFRKGPRHFVEEENSKSSMIENIRNAVKDGRPIEIVLPCLPFKDGNP